MLTYEPEGVPISIIKNDRDDKRDRKIKKRDKIIYLDEHSSSNNNYKEITLNEGGDEKFYLIPNTQSNRCIWFITGASGSGKTYKTAQIIREYQKCYPKNDVYLLSYIEQDSTLDSIKGVNRIKLDDEFIDTPLETEDFKNSLVVFDDTDCISEKQMKLKIKDLLLKLLNTGRHFYVSVIYLSHLPYGIDNKGILNEAHSITIFPSSLGNRSKKYLLDNYLGMSKKQIEAIDDIHGRSITIMKTYPMVLVSDYKIILVKQLGK
jgi:hypothetical protein